MTTQPVGSAPRPCRRCHRLCRSAGDVESSRTSMTRRSQQDPEQEFTKSGPRCISRSPGGTGRAGQVSYEYEQPPRGRRARLFEAADRRHVPLRTILVTVGVVVAAYLAGQLIYRLRDIVLLMLVAGFAAMLLNPVVAQVQRRVPRRGLAVTIVTLWAALVFISLAAAFGVPLVNGITHLAHRMPGYVASAQHGNGWIGHLAARYHVQSWVQRNTPKLAATPSRSASRP